MSANGSNHTLIRDEGRAALQAALKPGETFERLLCDPVRARAFCRQLRSRLGGARVTDFEILWTLLNWRKKGELCVR